VEERVSFEERVLLVLWRAHLQITWETDGKAEQGEAINTKMKMMVKVERFSIPVGWSLVSWAAMHEMGMVW
jgi:hypothetical protein